MAEPDDLGGQEIPVGQAMQLPQGYAPIPPPAQSPIVTQPGPPIESAEPPSWEDMKDHFSKAFPAVEPEFIEKRYNQALKLRKAREQYQDINPLHKEYGEFVVPGVVQGMESYEYNRARNRYAQGEAADSDYAIMARHERAEELRANMGGVEKFSRFVGSLPATIAHASVGGLPLVVAEQTFEHATQRNEELGRHPLDPRVMPTAATQAVLSALAFKAMGRYGMGIANPATKLIARAGIGAGTQQGLDVLAGAVDEILPEAYKTKTKYGTVGAIVRGEYGEALQKAGSDMLTMAAFDVSQGNVKGAYTRLHSDPSTWFKNEPSWRKGTGPGDMGTVYPVEPKAPPPTYEPTGPPVQGRGLNARLQELKPQEKPAPQSRSIDERIEELKQQYAGQPEAKKSGEKEMHHGYEVVRDVPADQMRALSPEMQEGGKFWIDDKGKKIYLSDELGSDKDVHEALDEALQIKRGMARGMSKDEAEKAEIGHDHREPKSVPPEKLSALYTSRPEQTASNGDRVRFVDGEKVRAIDPTFVEGGNHSALRYVPQGEIWVEDSIAKDHPNEVPFIVHHEMTEHEAMKGGADYQTAHQKASLEEFKMRHGQQPQPTQGQAAQPQAAPPQTPQEPETARQRVDRMESDHLDQIRTVNEAQNALRRAMENFSIGRGTKNDVTSAKKNLQAEKLVQKELEKHLDKARQQAIEEETAKHEPEINATAERIGEQSETVRREITSGLSEDFKQSHAARANQEAQGNGAGQGAAAVPQAAGGKLTPGDMGRNYFDRSDVKSMLGEERIMTKEEARAEQKKVMAEHEAKGVKPGQSAAAVPQAASGKLINMPKIGGGQETLSPSSSLHEVTSSFLSAVHKGKDFLDRIGGKMFPALSRLSQEAGNKAARFVSSSILAKEVTPWMKDQVLGKGMDQSDRLKFGGAFVEERLRQIRKAYLDAGDTDKADAVGTLINPLNPSAALTNENRFQQVINSPEYKALMERWKQHMVPEMEGNFRRAMGMEDTDPINSPSQIPGRPVNLKGLFADSSDTSTAGKITDVRTGNLRNVRQKKFMFAEQATGAHDAYEQDLGKIIEHSLDHGIKRAAQADLYRQLMADGIAKKGPPGAKVDFEGRKAEQLPFAFADRKGDTLYVHPDAYKELRQALAVDEPNKFFAKAGQIANLGALASTVEAAYHSKNLLTMMFNPRMGLMNLAKNAYGIYKGDPEIQQSLIDLARIGALRGKHEAPETLAGKIMQGGTKYDPRTYIGAALHGLDRAVRLTADQAFKSMAESGLAADTEQNRRDFINQVGQYNKRAQAGLVKSARDVGIGPFATAGTNYLVQGVKSLVADPGVKTTNPQAAMQLRMEKAARILAPLAAAAVYNYLRWGRLDGDDKVPLGGVKFSEDKNGNPLYFNVGDLTGITRGARSTGASALAEGVRAGAPAGATADKAVSNIATSAAFPFVGPLPRLAWMAVTGKNVFGDKVAEGAQPGESQAVKNLKAAALNFNPILGVATGAERAQYLHGKEESGWEKFNKLLGPYGLKTGHKAPGLIGIPNPKGRKSKES